jgi:oxygen-independent coproporphyrinogen-3 oxidase
MGTDLPPGPVGVYAHIPFCLTRCDYCSFFSVAYSAGLKREYLAWLRAETESCLALEPRLAQADTFYLGGGTPSLLTSDEINSLLAFFDLDREAEITLEVNPLQLTAEYLDALRSTPVNRLSLGVQSLDDEELAYLTRRHRASGIPEKVRLCREAGFANLSLDLIYGLPGSSTESLGRNLDAFLALEPEHLSCYLLTLEEGSPLLRAGAPALPSDDELSAQYHLIRSVLTTAGYGHYEISNFARPGRESRHNLKYWASRPWLGLGASASGWIPPLRYTNPADLEAYAAQTASGRVFPSAERISPEQLKKDWLMMGLRLLAGIDLQAYRERFGSDPGDDFRPGLQKMLDLGLLVREDNSLRLSPEALFVSNRVIGELI